MLVVVVVGVLDVVERDVVELLVDVDVLVLVDVDDVASVVSASEPAGTTTAGAVDGEPRP